MSRIECASATKGASSSLVSTSVQLISARKCIADSGFFRDVEGAIPYKIIEDNDLRLYTLLDVYYTDILTKKSVICNI